VGGAGREGGARIEAELVFDVLPVGLDGLHADPEFFGNRARGQGQADEAENLEFTIGQLGLDAAGLADMAGQRTEGGGGNTGAMQGTGQKAALGPGGMIEDAQTNAD
jgi:hypothetical protein